MLKLGWEIRYLNIILYSNEIGWVIVLLGPFLSNRSWNYFDCYESTPEISCLKPYFFRCIISKLTTIQWRQKDKSHTCALNRSLTISVIFKKKEVHKLYTHDIKRVLHNIYTFSLYIYTYKSVFLFVFFMFIFRFNEIPDWNFKLPHW